MLWFSLLVLSSVATSSSTAQVGAITSTTSLNEQSNIRFLQALAQGSKSLQHKQAQTAKIALEKAVQNNPRSPKAHHLLAIALAQLGQNELALTSLNTSVELGNRSLEADELRALLLIQLGKPEQARQLISSVDSLNMALIGVSLDDPESITSVSSYLNEPSYRGLLSSSVLAASAAKKGLRVQATSLAAVAQELGHQFSKAPWSNALRDLLGRMNKQGGSITSQGRLRTSFEQVKNPEFQAAGQAKVRSALRISTIAEAALALTFDSFRVDTAILSLHRAYLTERELLQDYTLNGLAWSSRVTIPLNKRPNATRLHLNLRVRDLHADNYKVHFANNLEGGPSLKLPLGPRTFIELGILPACGQKWH